MALDWIETAQIYVHTELRSSLLLNKLKAWRYLEGFRRKFKVREI